MKPALFLDIDGVLNSLGGWTTWGDTFDVDLSPSGQGPFRLALSKSMADAILDLDCDIFWCTTWQSDAHMVGDLLGIDAPFIDLDTRPGWKRQAVEEISTLVPRPFLWFEDEWGRYGTENNVGREHLPPHDAINPNPDTGITKFDIERAQRFLKEL